jgi:hypothetical protein
MILRYLLIVFSLVYTISLFAQDTIRYDFSKPILLSSKPGLYYIYPSDSTSKDSAIIVSSKLYFKLIQDKQSCVTFINLYQMYKNQVNTGDKEVSDLINSYENIIKTKDSSYTQLLKEYYILNGLLTTSIRQTETTINLNRNTLDTLSKSLEIMEDQNKELRSNLDVMKKQQNRNKLFFGAGGVAIGFLFGLLLLL